MEREYVASFKASRQIGPEDWESYRPVLKLTDNTTVGEIRDWYLNQLPNNVNKDKVKLDGIELSQF